MQLSPEVTKRDTRDFLEKKYETRPRQDKPENVTNQSSRLDIFGDKVIMEVLALTLTDSPTKNDSRMVTVSSLGRDVTDDCPTREEFISPA